MELPPSVGLLHNLTKFDASHNSLTKLPDTICGLSCKKIREIVKYYILTIFLCNTSVKGIVPSEFGHLISS